jgi:hypothetical protein
VFTDGDPDYNDAPIIPGVSKEWKDAGVTIFAVGIGPDISKEGLMDIAGNMKNVFPVKDFSELIDTLKKLLVDIIHENCYLTTKTPFLAPVTSPRPPVVSRKELVSGSPSVMFFFEDHLIQLLTVQEEALTLTRSIYI